MNAMEHALAAFTDIRGELIGLSTLTAAGANRNTGKLSLRDIQGAVRMHSHHVMSGGEENW